MVEDVRGGVISLLLGHVIKLVLISLAHSATPEAAAVPRHPPVKVSTAMLRPLHHVLHVLIAIGYVMYVRIRSTSW